MTTNYEAITYRPEGCRAHTIYLAEVTTTPTLLTGFEVDDDGDVKWFDHGTTERCHVIELSLIVRRDRLSRDANGRLVVA